MSRFGWNAVFWPVVPVLVMLSVLAAPSARGTEAIPQDRSGLGKDEPILPPSEDKGVIPPPPTGGEGIYKEAPNPEAGHEEEVIPPADVPEDDAVIDTNASD